MKFKTNKNLLQLCRSFEKKNNNKWNYLKIESCEKPYIRFKLRYNFLWLLATGFLYIYTFFSINYMALICILWISSDQSWLDSLLVCQNIIVINNKLLICHHPRERELQNLTWWLHKSMSSLQTSLNFMELN